MSEPNKPDLRNPDPAAHKPGISGCPGCGCLDGRVVDRHTDWYGQASDRRRCRHCGTIYSTPIEAADVPVVRYQPVRCPQCDSSDTYVTSTRKPVRHHRCRSCGFCFKSTE